MKKGGFTLSEVLITLVIIGVVAAITVPMLMNDTNDKQWNVARQKAQATIGEAFRLASVNNEISDKKSDGTRMTTEDFAKEILPKYLKIAKTCGSDSEAAKKCNFPSKVKRSTDGTEVNILTDWSQATNLWGYTKPLTVSNQWSPDSSDANPTKENYKTGYYLQTLDGFSLLLFYNPYCAYDENDKVVFHNDSDGWNAQQAIDVACFNAIYDMNGTKGANRVGKDVGFVGLFYNGYNAKAVAVLPHDKEYFANEAPGVTVTGSRSRAIQYCNSIGENNEWILPDLDELSLMYLNRYLVNTLTTEDSDYGFWTRTSQGKNLFGMVTSKYGSRTRGSEYSNGSVHCVRNNALK